MNLANKLFFRVKFRDKGSFTPYYESMYIACPSHLMRLLDLKVFQGNNFSTIHETLTWASFTAHLADQKDIVLSKNNDPAPYRYIMKNTSSIPYSEKLLLKNIIWDFSDDAFPIQSDIPNCAHKIEDDRCLVCATGFIRSSDSRKCLKCPATKVYDHGLQKCLKASNSFSFSEVNNIVGIQKQMNGLDYVDIGYTVDLGSSIYFYLKDIPPNPVSPPEALINESNILKGQTDNIYVISLDLTFNFLNEKHINDPFIFLNLGKSPNEHVAGQYFVDKIHLDSDRQTITKSIIFTVDYFPSVFEYNNINFMINFDNLSFSSYSGVVNASNKLQVFEFDFQDYIEKLPNWPNSANGKTHQVSFPLDYGVFTSVYIPRGLFEYDALDLNFDAEVPSGFYVERASLYKYIRKCPEDCNTCSSFLECVTCEDGFFLSNKNCLPCASS